MMTDHELHKLIGRRLRARRRLMDLTLLEVATACEISFQQVSKYEAGEAAISISRLLKLSQMLGVPIAYFIDPPA